MSQVTFGRLCLSSKMYDNSLNTKVLKCKIILSSSFVVVFLSKSTRLKALLFIFVPLSISVLFPSLLLSPCLNLFSLSFPKRLFHCGLLLVLVSVLPSMSFFSFHDQSPCHVSTGFPTFRHVSFRVMSFGPFLPLSGLVHPGRTGTLLET